MNPSTYSVLDLTLCGTEQLSTSVQAQQLQFPPTPAVSFEAHDLAWAVTSVSPPPLPAPFGSVGPWGPQQGQPQPQHPQQHLVYYFTALPEKAKPIWVVFYDRCDHPLDAFALQLFNEPTSSLDCTATASTTTTCVPAHRLQAESDLSWRATNNEGSLDVGLIQYKIAFTCPNDTFQRTIFSAHLVNSASGLHIDLGVMSIVSTTNQRSDPRFMAKLERRCPSEAHRRLVANFKRHPRQMRHFINGKGRSKGAKQASRRGHRFLMEEYVWAVHL
ncbi:uncharacterized protein ACA1_352470 [Acanthamoeba castellanii str. Neff]|uniref:Uncharacterized protein n=1 Tax=Acanthamoeba castellanii (strain ATCC 30010 / Neff) TaxID=1257118 RepID=L8GT79_ACACF|nr:uncharacterized protein ACA1_352470 [Acanthamoeba castellanii str. Neff]ELR16404.1 hypothetical protein ACA1_352470 [Acanthamoeba castellanii str. Neff]